MAVSFTKALLSAATTVAAGTGFKLPETPKYSFQCAGATTSGTGLATVKVQVSNDNVAWVTLATFTMNLTTTSASSGEGFITEADFPWDYVRGNVTAISGTGANVTLNVGG